MKTKWCCAACGEELDHPQKCPRCGGMEVHGVVNPELPVNFVASTIHLGAEVDPSEPSVVDAVATSEIIKWLRSRFDEGAKEITSFQEKLAVNPHRYFDYAQPAMEGACYTYWAGKIIDALEAGKGATFQSVLTYVEREMRVSAGGSLSTNPICNEMRRLEHACVTDIYEKMSKIKRGIPADA